MSLPMKSASAAIRGAVAARRVHVTIGHRGALACSFALLHTRRRSATIDAPRSSAASALSSSALLVVAAPRAHQRGTACSGLLRTTRVNLFLPPQLARLAGAAAFVLAQTFYVAYRRESRRLDEEESENERETGQKGARADTPFMTAVEAIQLLGIERSNPNVLEQARRISDGSRNAADVLPLTSPKDREVAKQNFDRMFALAMKHDNLFIAGKLSCAYRMCVDPDWDQTTYNTNTDAFPKDTAAEQVGEGQPPSSHPEK